MGELVFFSFGILHKVPGILGLVQPSVWGGWEMYNAGIYKRKEKKNKYLIQSLCHTLEKPTPAVPPARFGTGYLYCSDSVEINKTYQKYAYIYAQKHQNILIAEFPGEYLVSVGAIFSKR